ncbi:swi5-dependent recombination DNA repair protein 1 homolog isoform X2 [Ambystoma mexicanum]|uniref:swi5-dependent recombination DNA repair protein 1 homolog isoform X2 n=1 Tax=Ambystoma mexicanum TaxID=8296 RepID=UPI0037E8D1D1
MLWLCPYLSTFFERCAPPCKLSQPMSATLRERLKKTRRSFNTFSTVAKRLKVDYDGNDNPTSADVSSLNTNTPVKQEHAEERSTAATILKRPQQGLDCWKHKPQTFPNSPKPVSLRFGVKHPELLEEKKRLMKQVQQKEELLRRLKMVKMYRSKNNLTELQSLIEKWRSISQQLLYELQSALSLEGQKLSLSQLIDSCGLEDSLLHYNRAEEDFVDP